jgi:hypothetical protein
MAAMNRVLTVALCLAMTGCASEGVGRTDRHQREGISQSLEGLNQGLRAGTWSRVERFFSPTYQEGYGELRDRMEARFRAEQIIDLQFMVNRVLERDGLVNAQVRWRKSWVSKTGIPGKSEGLSDFILKPHGSSYRVQQITGDPLF